MGLPRIQLSARGSEDAEDPSVESARMRKGSELPEVMELEESLEESVALEKLIQEEAQLRVSVDRRVKLDPRFKTLFLGLRVNHERNAAALYPVLFLVRRFFFALVIMTMGSTPFWPVHLVLLSSFVVLVFLVSERPWASKLVGWQEIANESITYLACMIVLTFSRGVGDSESRTAMGWLLITICMIYVLFNCAVIMTVARQEMRQHFKRSVLLVRRDRVREEVRQMVKSLDADLHMIPRPEPIISEEATLSEIFYQRGIIELQHRQFMIFNSMSRGFGAELYCGEFPEEWVWYQHSVASDSCPRDRSLSGQPEVQIEQNQSIPDINGTIQSEEEKNQENLGKLAS